MRVDLHMHSNNSDGTESVESIIDRAVKKGLEAIAITDHDNVNGLKRASEYAKGKIGFVNGIEVSAYQGREIHILGYGVDFNDKQLLEKTEKLLAQRKTRIKKIITALREQDVIIGEDEVDFKFVGRLEIAKLMVKKKYVPTIGQAFDTYLGSEGSAYFPSARLSPVDACKMIVAAGGKPVIAHPEKYLVAGILDDLILSLKPYGLVGLECHYPSHSEETTYRLVAIAKQYDLIETVGCDFHGSNGQNDIGQVKFEMSRSNVEYLAGHTL